MIIINKKKLIYQILAYLNICLFAHSHQYIVPINKKYELGSF